MDEGPDDLASNEAEIVSAPAASPAAPGDYDGDGKADIAVKGANGVWYIDVAANGFGGRWDYAYWGYGDGTALPVPANYDGVGGTDISVRDGTGMWGVDLATDRFGGWNNQYFGYGNSTTVPVPADYDHDGKADLSIKDASGNWYIDYSTNGLVGWDVIVGGYGNSLAIPTPGDYDGDGFADLSIRGSDGCWYIDYARINNSGGTCSTLGSNRGCFGGWNQIVCGYGTAQPIPFDYDNDGKTDMAVKDNSGVWYIDAAGDGFAGWNAIYTGRGNDTCKGVPGDYDHDGHTDLAVSCTNGNWSIDYWSNGLTGYDFTVNNSTRPYFDTTKPYISATTVYGEGNIFYGGFTTPSTIPTTATLTIGVRYTVDVTVQPGSRENLACSVSAPCGVGYDCGTDARCHGSAGIEAIPEMNPSPLNLAYASGSTYAAIPTATHRRYAITCSAPGSYALGFQLRNHPDYYGDTQAFNQDYGIRINCTANGRTGLYGKVTQRFVNGAGVYIDGPAISGATISTGILSTTSASDGFWSLPTATGGPLTVTVSASGFSKTIAVNVQVPPSSGVELDTRLEEPFSNLSLAGVTYTSYLDYAKGRSLLHVLKVNPLAVIVALKQSALRGTVAGACTSPYVPGLTTTSTPSFDDLLHIATLTPNFLALINGIWWDGCNGESVGYSYAAGTTLHPEVWCDGGAQLAPGTTTNCTGSNIYYTEAGAAMWPQNDMPMLTINGTSSNQHFDIVDTHDNFMESPSTTWTHTGLSTSTAIWDVSPRNGISDVSYAMQIANPPLLVGGNVVKAGPHWCSSPVCDYDGGIARTAIGVGTGALAPMYMVVADGEGVHGGNGPTSNKLGHFFRDVLGATTAFGLDSGLSTEMVVQGSAGARRINTITGEDAGIQANPYTEALRESPTLTWGTVANYLRVTD